MSNNFYDFIEIGTSDFDTLIEKANDTQRGISIEPIKYFLDRLPNPKNCVKICAAILDKEGEADIHYIKDENIKKYNLPDFVRGSSSINDRHPFVLKLLANEAKDNLLPKPIDPDSIYSSKKVPVKRLKHIIDEYQIDEIKILKIDAEGTDELIITDYFNCCENEGYPYPHFVQYEHVLMSIESQKKIRKTATRLGYLIQEGDPLNCNTFLIRKRQTKICPTCGGKGRINE
tara:strand:- start:118 stop:810 length:693 start_codon:yes stop_codon:yes gene_type:complete